MADGVDVVLYGFAVAINSFDLMQKRCRRSHFMPTNIFHQIFMLFRYNRIMAKA